jgi:hypothetical protein
MALAQPGDPPIVRKKPLNASNRWENRSEKYREYHRKAKRRRYKQKRTFINGKKDVPCSDCGVKYPPYVMQFDHVKGRKLFNIGAGIIAVAWKKVLTELKKCEVVCANCHAKRTYGGK